MSSLPDPTSAITSTVPVAITATVPVAGSSRSGKPTRRLPLVAALLALALLAAGCSTGPGTEEELATVLEETAGLSQSEATCVAEAVFDEYETDQDALGTISAAPDFEFLSGEDGVPGFGEFFEAAVQRCASEGPVSG